MRNRILLLFLTLVLVVSLVAFAACKAEEEAPPVEEEAPLVEEPKYGGTLRVIFQATSGGFDMHRRPSWGPILGYPVYNHLVYFDPTKPGLDAENILPDLAERWEVSADGKTWTFFLHKGVKWHDGMPFTADDVVYNLEKMTDPERSAISANFMAFDRAEKVDDYTVKVYLKSPSPSFLIQLAGPYATIQAKHKADVDWKTTDYLVGTGPFMFDSYVSGVSYELVRNPDYFKKDKYGNQLPYLDGFIAYVITDRSAQTDALLTNRVDIAQPQMGIPNQEQWERLKASGLDLVYQDEKKPSGSALWFNLDYEPLSDLRVRQAMFMLVNRKELTVAVRGDEQWGIYDNAIFAPAWALPTEEIDEIMGWDKPWEYRVAEAKRLMNEAGYADGFDLELTGWNVVEVAREFSYLGDIWGRHLNIDVKIRQGGWGDVTVWRGSGDYQVIKADWGGYVGDPSEIVGYLITGGISNFSGYSNPELDELIEEQAQCMDPAERKELVNEIERILLREAVVFPHAQERYAHAAWPYVKNFVCQWVGYGSKWMYEQVWLAK